MKYLKRFENKNSEPQIGDYVLCHAKDGDYIVDDFINQNVGEYVDYIDGVTFPCKISIDGKIVGVNLE